MSERSDDGKTGAFLLGFLLGVLVCLGAGGVYVTLWTTRQAEAARQAEMMAREEAVRSREALDRAEAERRRADEILAETRKKDKDKGEKERQEKDKVKD